MYRHYKGEQSSADVTVSSGKNTDNVAPTEYAAEDKAQCFCGEQFMSKYHCTRRRIVAAILVVVVLLIGVVAAVVVVTLSGE